VITITREEYSCENLGYALAYLAHKWAASRQIQEMVKILKTYLDIQFSF
jgi:hypothetical protein